MAGRKTKYTDEIKEKAYKLALLGLTDKEMIEVFGVVEQTWYNWLDKHPEFRKALAKGKIEADANVTLSMYKRAVGYEYQEEVVNVVDKEIVKTKVTKHQAPNPTAFIFWLKNRTGRKHNIQEFSWRDVNQTELTGRDGGPIKTANIDIAKLDLSDLTDEELQAAEILGLKLRKKERDA
mgnify:CR=1 FL=1